MFDIFRKGGRIVRMKNCIFEKNKKSIENLIRYTIYALYKNNKIVYIGKCKNHLSRVINHLNRNIVIFDYYSFVIVDSQDKMDKLEKKLIFKYKPKYNKTYIHSNLRKKLIQINKRNNEPKNKRRFTIFGNFGDYDNSWKHRKPPIQQTRESNKLNKIKQDFLIAQKEYKELCDRRNIKMI